MSESAPTGDFGDFERLEGPPLGTGATGRVYRARQKSLRRPAALKVIDRLTTDPQDIPQLDARFQREILALGQIKHPNVVAIYAAGVANGKPWTAMECLEGGTLDGEIARRINEKRWFSDAEIVRIGIAASSGLAAALDRGIIHRDLKPSNILFDGDGRPVVTDFGMAKLRGTDAEGLEPLTGSKDILGTPAFMSPEQIMPPRDGPVDHRSDIYALGAVLYNIATLAPPFSGKSPYDVMNRHLTEEPDSIRSKNPACSPALEAVILRCLAKSRAVRPQTYAEVITELEKVRTSPGASAISPISKGSRYRMVVAAAALLLLVALGVFAAAGQLRSKTPNSESGNPPKAGPPPSAAPPPPAVSSNEDHKSDERKDDASSDKPDRSNDGKDPSAPPKEPPEPLRTILAKHAALQPAELALVRDLREKFRSRHQDLQKRSYDALLGDFEALAKDERQTAYTRQQLDGARTLVEGAQDAVAARLRTLATPSSMVTVRLKDGAVVAGSVAGSDRDSVTLSTSDGKSVRIHFADLSLEDFTSGSPVPIPCLALRGLSGLTSTVLREALGLSTEKEELILWLPCLTWIALEDGRAYGKSGDLAGAKATFQAMTAVKEDLAPLFSFLGETFDSVRSETEAIDRFERKLWPEVLAGFPGTCVFAAAEKEFWESFRREATEDLILRSRGQLEWKLHPTTTDGKELLRLWDQKPDTDGKESTFLHGDDKTRSIVRIEPTPQAGEGLFLVVRFSQTKDEGDGYFEVTLNPTSDGSNYLRVAKGTVSLVHDKTRPERKRETIAGGPMPPPESESAWRQVALIPSGDRLFVLLDGKLVAHAEKVTIPSIFAIGIRHGDLALRSVLVKPATSSSKDK